MTIERFIAFSGKSPILAHGISFTSYHRMKTPEVFAVPWWQDTGQLTQIWNVQTISKSDIIEEPSWQVLSLALPELVSTVQRQQ